MVGELGREFNLTARNELLADRSRPVCWSDGRPARFQSMRVSQNKQNISHLVLTLTFLYKI